MWLSKWQQQEMISVVLFFVCIEQTLGIYYLLFTIHKMSDQQIYSTGKRF